jgi:hypothetical protein
MNKPGWVVKLHKLFEVEKHRMNFVPTSPGLIVNFFTIIFYLLPADSPNMPIIISEYDFPRNGF